MSIQTSGTPSFPAGTILTRRRDQRVYLGSYPTSSNKVTYHFMPLDTFWNLLHKKRSFFRLTDKDRMAYSTLKGRQIGVVSGQIPEEDFEAFRAKYEMTNCAYPEDPKAATMESFTLKHLGEMIDNAFFRNQTYYSGRFSDNQRVRVSMNYNTRLYEAEVQRLTEIQEGVFKGCFEYKKEAVYTFERLCELWEFIQPQYKKCYLTNGKFFCYEFAPDTLNKLRCTPQRLEHFLGLEPTQN